ncbi:ROK family protein, partial [archaeon]
MRVFVGIDIGGSHFGAGIINENDDVLAISSTKWSNLELTPEVAVNKISKAVNLLLAEASNAVASSSARAGFTVVAIGIGCPGQAKDNVLVAASNLPLFKNVPLADMISREMGHIPTVLVNDADAAICAEVFGHAETYQSMRNIAMVTLGTGIGFGLVLNNQLFQGSHGLLEGGHMVVATGPNSRLCDCGQMGCVEAYSSASNTARRLEEYDQADRRPSASSLSTSSLTGYDVFARYAVNDFNAVRVVEETAEHLAVFCLNVCRVVDPDAIVFGGGLAQAGDVLLDLVRKYLVQKTWTVLPTHVQLLKGVGIGEAGVKGAAYAARQMCGTRNAPSPSPDSRASNSVHS